MGLETYDCACQVHARAPCRGAVEPFWLLEVEAEELVARHRRVWLRCDVVVELCCGEAFQVMSCQIQVMACGLGELLVAELGAVHDVV